MMSQVCIDASIALRLILPTDQSAQADSLFQKWHEAGQQIISPPLFDFEMISNIRKLMQMKLILPQQGEQAFQYFQELAISIINPAPLLRTAWELTSKYDRTQWYDLHYLALAELNDCDLWTARKMFYKNLKDKNQRLHYLGDHTTPPVAVDNKTDAHKTTRSDFPGLWRAI
jgi:predicted nucleic acid-binding protein